MLQPRLPWWRVSAMWLVVGGPAVVVAASFAMLALAVRGGDVPLNPPPVGAAPQDRAMTPAKQARNHVATPVR